MINLLNDIATQILLFSVLGFILLIGIVIFTIVPLRPWFKCLVSGSYVGMVRLVGMKLRKVDVDLITTTYITARKAGLSITIEELETHVLAGGNIQKVVAALISAHSSRISLSNNQAKAIDLAGRDVKKAVSESITPKVIRTPDIEAMAQNGYIIRVRAKITVKTNLDRIIGGAGEDTIIARVNEGIVQTVGGAVSHEIIQQNPEKISETVQNQGLDDGTAFQIISINIEDIDIVRNAGAELLQKTAESEKVIAQAKAEKRRVEAIASEHEMRAISEHMRSELLKAETNVPKALAEAFKSGKLGVMDYYNMQNLIADTSMRNSLSGKKQLKNSPKDPSGSTTGEDN